MFDEFAAEIIGFAGIAFTAYLAWIREREKIRKDKRAATYALFIDAQSVASQPISLTATDKMLKGMDLTELEAEIVNSNQKNFAKAHAEILINGSQDVVKALEHFYEVSSMSDQTLNETSAAFSGLIRAMREDSNSKIYEGFEQHVDSIAGNGPERRRQQMIAAKTTPQQK